MITKSLTAAATLAAAGWGAHAYLEDTYADAERVEVVEAQAMFVLDRQMAAVVSEIAWLERISKTQSLTPTQVETLRYLREQLDQMRRVRSLK
jgi:hypothetical protein